MSDPIQELAVPRSTGTHGDIFAAVGLADLLSRIPGMAAVKLQASATAFRIILPRSLSQHDYEQLSHSPGYPYLKTNEKVAVPSGIRDVVDYKAEKAKADRLRAARNAIRGKSGDAELRMLEQMDQPRDDWRLIQVLNTLQGDETSNKVYETINGLEAGKFRGEVEAALSQMASGKPTTTSWRANSVQLF
ncbi:MAG: hypothetical protein ACYDAG_06680, partial [Chloroflexota bacterium]